MASSSTLSPKIIAILVIPVILLLSLVAASYLFQVPIPDQMDMTVKKIGGTDISTQDYKGKILIMEFFATYCDYCRETAQNIVSIMQKNDVSNVMFLSVSIDPFHDKDPQLESFISDNNLTSYVGTNWLFTRDMTGQNTDYGVSAIPDSFLVNPDGVIVTHHIGLLSYDTLLSWINGQTTATT